MGQFSYKCKCCKKPIKNNRDNVVMFYLVNGKAKEMQIGLYDGYGRANGDWNTNWQKIVDHDFSKNTKNGIACYHVECFNGKIPITRSQKDPNQGW